MDLLLRGSREPTLPESADQGDDRSSSLSEIDRNGNGNATDNSQMSDDTEAETERLDHSTPQKRRKHESVVLVSDAGSYLNQGQTFRDVTVPDVPGSDISSLDSSEVDQEYQSHPPSPRKRKRSSYGSDVASDQKSAADEISSLMKSPPGTSIVSNPSGGDEGENASKRRPKLHVDEDGLGEDQSTANSPNLAPKKEKTKGKKLRDRQLALTREAVTAPSVFADQGEDAESMSSNGEDVEQEENVDIEADAALKTEEGLKRKKTALDSLSALERSFARLRDKLFDERLTQANEEITLLEHASPIHPELLAMKEVIDERRDQKIMFQREYLKQKLSCLQRESIAGKHQVHAQYMQTVREIRDTSLDQLNKENYQLHRERRSCEDDVPNYSYKFQTKRSSLIKHQTAYNNEISILSGVAKWIGFPAAPAISQARPKEIDNDLWNMGIRAAPQITPALQNHTPLLRSTLSAAAGISRQRPAAEEQFLDQNPWANPQHPVHHRQRQPVQRHFSTTSRAVSPSPTSAVQRLDSSHPQDSVSMIVKPLTVPNSPVISTPAPAEGPKPSQTGPSHLINGLTTGSVPSKSKYTMTETLNSAEPVLDTVSEKERVHLSDTNERPASPPLQRTLSGRDSQTSKGLPKPLPFIQIGGSARASPPVRFPIKMEDSSRMSLHSAMPHQFNSPAAVTAAAPRQMNRFAA